MENFQLLINGQDLGEPRNWQDLEITADWITKKEEGSINISELSFVDRANRYLQQRIQNGISGGVGVFEGEPIQLNVGQIGNPVFTFDGYLDFTESLSFIGGEEITCSLKKLQGTDWLTDIADSFTFAYLEGQGEISSSDYVKVPYVINFVPDNMQLIVLSMSIYMMTKEIIENIQEISEAIAALIDAATPVVGVSVGLGAGVVTAWDLGNFIWASLKVLARIAYTIAMVIAIKNLMEELFEQLMPKKRYHLGMRFETLFIKACAHLGLQFSSQLLASKRDWVHIPRKDRKGGESGEKGVPESDGPIATFGDLIRVAKTKWNADYRISNGVFYFERRDAFEQLGGYVIKPYFNNQERLLTQFEFNTDEMISNYNIFWNTDVQDQNTLEDRTGMAFSAITSPVSVINPKLVNIKNLAQIEIPFSQGKEKTGLTEVERILRNLARVVDGLTGIFGGGTNFVSKIESRIGSLLLSSHLLTIGKVVVMSGNKLANNQRELLRAKRFWDEFHYINSFAEVNGEHNQYFIFKGLRVPMTLAEFDLILENNRATDENGNVIWIHTCAYKPYENAATMDFRLKKKYTNNLKVEYVE